MNKNELFEVTLNLAKFFYQEIATFENVCPINHVFWARPKNRLKNSLEPENKHALRQHEDSI